MKGSHTTWTIACPEMNLSGLPANISPMVEIDVGGRCIRLSHGAPHAVQHAQLAGSVIRRFMEGQSMDWSPAVTWLGSDEARAMTRSVDEGISRSLLWSGDMVIQWTESSKRSIDALFVGIDGACAK